MTASSDVLTPCVFRFYGCTHLHLHHADTLNTGRHIDSIRTHALNGSAGGRNARRSATVRICTHACIYYIWGGFNFMTNKNAKTNAQVRTSREVFRDCLQRCKSAVANAPLSSICVCMCVAATSCCFNDDDNDDDINNDGPYLLNVCVSVYEWYTCLRLYMSPVYVCRSFGAPCPEQRRGR